MDTKTKQSFSTFTFYLLLGVGAVFLVGVIDLVLCTGLKINPFTERATTLLFAAFIGLIGIAIVTFLLNVAANLSLLAESKNGPAPARPFPMKMFAILFGLVAFSSVALIAGGTWASERRFLAVVEKQTEEILSQNKDLVARLGVLIQGQSRKEFEEVSSILHFLGSQRRNLPNLTLIYDGTFENKPALYQANAYLPKDVGPYVPRYYECYQERDCQYLKDFFSGKQPPKLSSFSRSSGTFYIYYPVETGKRRFILLLERNNSYGKLGSS
jgi:hypothetical protein